MLTNQGFLTIKEAAHRFNKSEQTIRRLVKQYAMTSHIRTEKTLKGNAYLISSNFLVKHYETDAKQDDLTVSVTAYDNEKVISLEAALVERDQVIQQLQHRLLEQNDVLNALTSQMNSQKISYIEELIMKQNEQLSELQKRLPEANNDEVAPVESIKKGFWQRLFGR